MTEVAFVLGTRPEIIKLSPVIRSCDRHGVDHAVIHTGQHYSERLDSVFFDRLGLAEPEVNLGVGSGPHGEQTGEMLRGVERVITDVDPDIVVVQGDTNSALAGALAASKMDPELAHVEAGLRSFDRSMPEETNRVIVDHVADHLFAPTEKSEKYLVREGVPEHRITVTGNTVVDALERIRDVARREATVLDDLGLATGGYLLMTAHRQENVDDPDRFRSLLDGAAGAGRDHGLEVVYPIHPRARGKIEEFGLDVPPPVRTVDPQDYLDFVRLLSASAAVLTDSGGVQEEACVLGVPCVTMRDNTERPETIDAGANRLSSCDPDRIRRAVTEALDTDGAWENPYGDGEAAARILRALPVSAEIDEVVR
ncbi:non-hydrolyzing UDP-N-acetylglucosamine 2-epimerase [Halorubrum sp. Ea8]|uniref:non-hydrolyzing UDP-N-acetylglucosamine 2-epimerase n=1 Tax=Halorubrum sp. Ea8 TaxID=1383841 RepID=UPI000B99953A|nr:UDP-N-acetylglucosamine 2-epimerase (non-hydrolyzing) [Halorubrum sp. Ea8]OYR48356.1 UDP-N-acetylglucosamine 2-epimerase (non-hydrolyzing) [Halorubrum sp. Ea8]